MKVATPHIIWHIVDTANMANANANIHCELCNVYMHCGRRVHCIVWLMIDDNVSDDNMAMITTTIDDNDDGDNDDDNGNDDDDDDDRHTASDRWSTRRKRSRRCTRPCSTTQHIPEFLSLSCIFLIFYHYLVYSWLTIIILRIPNCPSLSCVSFFYFSHCQEWDLIIHSAHSADCSFWDI